MNDSWTSGPDMIRARRLHACAMRGNEVFVIGGEADSRNSLEVWNGKSWFYSVTPIGATNLQLKSQGRNLYLFGGWDYWDHQAGSHRLSNTVWKIDHNNEFTEAGNILIARKNYALLTLPHGFLTNCQGMSI